MTDIISTHDFESSAAWKAEVNRRLRVALVELYVAKAPPPSEADMKEMYERIALETFEPSGKPQ